MSRTVTPRQPGDVAAVFQAYPPKARRKLIALRKIIFATAATTNGVGRLEETLKWGEPAYLTAETGSGSTIRLGWKKKDPDHVAMFFHCGTDLVHRFRRMFPDDLEFEGNRAIMLPLDAALLRKPLAACIAAALTYHLDKARTRPRRTTR